MTIESLQLFLDAASGPEGNPRRAEVPLIVLQTKPPWLTDGLLLTINGRVYSVRNIVWEAHVVRFDLQDTAILASSFVN